MLKYNFMQYHPSKFQRGLISRGLLSSSSFSKDLKASVFRFISRFDFFTCAFTLFVYLSNKRFNSAAFPNGFVKYLIQKEYVELAEFFRSKYCLLFEEEHYSAAVKAAKIRFIKYLHGLNLTCGEIHLRNFVDKEALSFVVEKVCEERKSVVYDLPCSEDLAHYVVSALACKVNRMIAKNTCNCESCKEEVKDNDECLTEDCPKHADVSLNCEETKLFRRGYVFGNLIERGFHELARTVYPKFSKETLLDLDEDLHFVQTAAKTGDKEMVEWLLGEGFGDMCVAEGAAAGGRVELLRWALFEKNNFGYRPFYHGIEGAAEVGCIAAMDIFFQRCGKSCLKPEVVNQLMVKENQEVIFWLDRHGAVFPTSLVVKDENNLLWGFQHAAKASSEYCEFLYNFLSEKNGGSAIEIPHAFVCSLAYHNNLKTLKWALSKGVQLDCKILKSHINERNYFVSIKFVKEVLRAGLCGFDPIYLENYASVGNLRAFEWLDSNFPGNVSVDCSKIAAEKGKLSILKYIWSKKYPIVDDINYKAAYRRQTSIVKWLLANNVCKKWEITSLKFYQCPVIRLADALNDATDERGIREIEQFFTK